MKYILTDVEGTTTSISFVHDLLFPYAKKHIQTYIESNLNNDIVQEVIASTQKTILDEENRSLDVSQSIQQLSSWIDLDRKHPALKKIQGLIWKNGYQSGALKGHIYSDVPAALEAWKKNGLNLGVYSSGSIQAQKDLFKHSDFGDLSHYFSHHFDTAIGHKREINSYQVIADQLGVSPSEILFLSDIKEELDAAKAVGFKTIQLVRQGELAIDGHKQVKSFSDIIF